MLRQFLITVTTIELNVHCDIHRAIHLRAVNIETDKLLIEQIVSVIIEIFCYTVTIPTQLVYAEYLTGMHIKQLLILHKQGLNSGILDVMAYLPHDIGTASFDIIVHLHSLSYGRQLRNDLGIEITLIADCCGDILNCTGCENAVINHRRLSPVAKGSIDPLRSIGT